MVSPQTILVIDDDPDIRGDMQMLLEGRGYRVLTAPDGQAGLHRAFADRPDLVIIDMMMPKMSGLAVVERIKQSSRPTPVIMLTANESPQQRTLAVFLGVDAYLNKPVRLAQLTDHIERLCPPPPLAATQLPADTAL